MNATAGAPQPEPRRGHCPLPPAARVPLRARGLRVAGPVAARTWHRLFEDRILGLAAEAGFWAIVSLPSLMLTLLGAVGYLRGVLGPDNVATVRLDILRAARDVLTPSTVANDVAPLVDQVLSGGHLEVVSVGFVLTLWSGSTAMSDYVNTITVAYDMRGLRSAWRSRVVATWLYLCFVAFGVVLLPALALGPGLLVSLAPDPIADAVRTTVHLLYWPVVGAGSVLILAWLYKLALPVRVRWRRGLPGAVLAMALWLVGSFALRAYLSSSFRAKSVYGSLSAPIAALLFFYVTALAVLIGAEVNSAIDAVRPVASTADGRERSRRAAGEHPG